MAICSVAALASGGCASMHPDLGAANVEIEIIAGVVEIMRRQQQGWSYLRPGSPASIEGAPSLMVASRARVAVLMTETALVSELTT